MPDKKLDVATLTNTIAKLEAEMQSQPSQKRQAELREHLQDVRAILRLLTSDAGTNLSPN
jgi:hypothetical protein